MNLFDWYFGQLVSEGQMDQAFDNAQQADRDVVSDFGFIGITDGLIGTPGTGAKEIDITAGTAYDNSGRRIRVAAPQLADLSVDSDGAPITNPAAGNILWTAVFAKFDLALSNVQVDGTGTEVLFNIDESFELIVRQAPEDIPSSATRPIGNPDEVKLFDVKIEETTTTIPAPNIDITNKQFAFDAVVGSLEVREGKIVDFAVGLLTVIAGGGGAAGIGFDPANTAAQWALVAAATNVQEAIDGLTDDLEDSTGVGSSGQDRIGADNTGIGAGLDYTTLATAATVADSFTAVVADFNSGTGVGGAGKVQFNSPNITPPVLNLSADWPSLFVGAQSLNGVVQAIIDDLALVTSELNRGTSMIGHFSAEPLRDTTVISTQSVGQWLDALMEKLGGDSGGLAIGVNDLVSDSASDTFTNNHRISRSSGTESVEDFCHGNQDEIINRVVQKIAAVETPAGVDISNIANWAEDHAPNVSEPNLLIEAQIASGVYARMYVDAKVGFLFTVNAKMQHASNVWARDDNTLGSNVFGGLPNLEGAGPVGTGNNMGYAHRPGTDTDTWTSANWAAGTGEFISFNVSAGVGTIDLPGGTLDGTET